MLGVQNGILQIVGGAELPPHSWPFLVQLSRGAMRRFKRSGVAVL